MIEQFVTAMIQIWATIPFSFATWFVIFVLGFFIWLFSKSSKNPSSMVQWEHMILDSRTNRTSPYKVGYLVGIIVSTWIVITFANANHLTFDIFGTYLTFLLGGAGVNIFAKRDQIQPPPPDDANDPSKQN